MAHPHLLGGGSAPEQTTTASVERHRCSAVLTATAVIHPAPVLLSDHLRAVANPKNRHAQVVDFGIDQDCAFDVNRGWTSTENDPCRVLGCYLLRGDRRGHDLAVDIGLPHPPSDQLRVLSTKVDHKNRLSWRRCLVHLASQSHAVSNRNETLNAPPWNRPADNSVFRLLGSKRALGPFNFKSTTRDCQTLRDTNDTGCDPARTVQSAVGVGEVADAEAVSWLSLVPYLKVPFL